jgi:hypothetical protein
MKKYLSESPKKNKLFAGVAHAEKYQSGSFIGQKLVDNFMDSILDMVQKTNTKEVHEIGCGEVLEHLTEPEKALLKLISITKKDLILSVPNEPIWHILNMLRGKYLTALGNTPGHFQHWSKSEFVNFVSKHADIIDVKTPLPWILVHCRPKIRK